MPGLAPDHLLVGASAGADALASHPGFDVEYQYIAGGLPDGSGPCSRCDSGCTALSVEGTTTVRNSCANTAGGCAWWACWQWDQDPPGTQYGSAYASGAAGRGRIAMFTYYQLLQSYRQLDPSFPEGTQEATRAANDRAFMSRYLADLRFLLQRIGTSPALVHVEPDFWAYAQHANPDPHRIAAQVAAANPTDCAGQENSIAGLGRCMIAMVRKYAPNAKVGLHASTWASGIDVSLNTDPALDVAAEAAKVGAFLAACGAADADVVVADIADRDAADGGRWLDRGDTLPSIRQVLVFGEVVAQRVGRPIVWWQIPVGNMSLPDEVNRYRDDKLDWFFDHAAEVARRGAIGVAFGGGQWSSTTPETDGGNLYRRAAAYGAAGGVKLCR